MRMNFSGEQTLIIIRNAAGVDVEIHAPFFEVIEWDGRWWRYSHAERLPVYKETEPPH
jgi:hypothetical protein